MIKWFDKIGRDDIRLVGGKAINLARLTDFGFDVPGGFVISTEVYDAYIGMNDRKNKIQEVQNSEKPTADQSNEIRAFFDSEKMDSGVRSEILKAFKQLGAARVAVRSSATVEDLPGMSFAGQYSSYLNVTEGELIEKIILCWQSLWNERAMEYRRRNNVTGTFSHAVIVQTMVDAQSAGVLFTANPINGIRNEMVVNAAAGLGEAIVSGEIHPDQLVINKETESVVDSQCTGKPVLSNEMINLLVEAGKKAEKHYGTPQDMEYAFDKEGGLKIVQSREITTLFPMDYLVQDDKLRAYLNAGTVMLGMKEPFTPLGYDIMSNMYPTVINVMTARKKNPLTNNFVKHTAGRMFVDMTYLMASKMVSKQYANSFSLNDLPLKGVMDKVMDEYGKTFRHQGFRFRMPLGVIKYSLSLIGILRSINKIPKDQRYNAMRRISKDAYEQQKVIYNKLQSDEERIAFADQVLIEAFILSQRQAMYCMDVNNLQKIEKILKKHFGNTYKPEVLVQSLEGCVTQSMMLRLNEYARDQDAAGKQPAADDIAFLEILEEFGHRANIELDLGTARWREDPAYLLELTTSFLDNKMYERNLVDHMAKRKEAEAMIEDVYIKLKKKKGERSAAKVKMLMVNYRYAIAMREYPKSCIVKYMDLGRQALQQIGERLVKDGRLNQRDDIFFLYKKDILTDQNLQVLADKNKLNYQKEMKRTTIPRMILNNGATYYNATVIDPDADQLQGMALSPGSYEGVIKVVFDPKNADHKEGEIMVTESTNPAWTPLFALAGALIMEYGGPVSHGGIVAREYGIPAVVGIPSATSVLKDGQRVQVDGETGLVEVLK